MKRTIIVLDTKEKPICLFCDILPIETKDKLSPGIYYEASFLGIQQNIIILRVDKELGEFGNIELEKKIMEEYKNKLFKLSNKKEDMKLGRINVNWNYTKVLKGDGPPKYLSQVN